MLFLKYKILRYRPDIPLITVANWVGLTEKELIKWLAEKGINVQLGGNLDCRQYANTQL